jgi:hypothetical protein
MIHLRIDHEELNSKRKFACGLGPDLPEGDQYYFESEAIGDYKVDCPGCNPGAPRRLGTPLSELSGRPGHKGYDEFCRIAQSWGLE